MTVYNYRMLDEAVERGEASTCISVNGARIIIPTDCKEVVGFTNPDDLDVDLLARWKSGERGPEFENQKLMPGDCLVMYDNGRNFHKILDKDPDWYKSPEGIKKVIEELYVCAEAGGKNTEEMWKENGGKAIEALKSPVKQHFIHVQPGDKLLSSNGIVQTAGAMSAIAVKQPDGNWNIVQLSAKGYAVVDENIRTNSVVHNKQIFDSKSRE